MNPKLAKSFVVVAIASLCVGWQNRPADESGDPSSKAAAKPGEQDKTPKAVLPKYFDQLELSDKQKDQVTKTMKGYDTKIAELKQKLADASKVPGGTSMVVVAANAIKKLTNQRQQALEETLTKEQRTKLQELRSAK